MARNQARDAQDLYDDRASKYDDSHHPRFACHMVELAKIQTGETVLDLACGTGLVTFLASSAVGTDGRVIGVDISSGILAEAEAKKSTHSVNNVEFNQHSMTGLRTLPAVRDEKFDLVTCCSALVLLEYPIEAIKEWTTYLKPGGRLVVDATHIQNLTPGIIFERVGHRLDRPLPWYRLNFPQNYSLEKAMLQVGLRDVEVTFLFQQLADSGSEDLEDYIQDADSPRIYKTHSIEDAETVFDSQIDGTPMKALASPNEVRQRAREVFSGGMGQSCGCGCNGTGGRWGLCRNWTQALDSFFDY